MNGNEMQYSAFGAESEAEKEIETAKENETAENKKKKDPGKAHIELTRPLKYGDGEISSLDFDFERLTGADGLNIEQEIQARGRAVLIPTLDSEYLLGMAARACRQQVDADFLLKMPLRDNLRVRSAVRNFLNASE